MKSKIIIVFLSFSFLSLCAEDLEFLSTTTSVYSGGSGLTGATAYTMPSGNNSYVGWVWFPEGFIIDNGNTAALNIIPSVDGDVDLNDGTLTITGDLILGSNVAITNNGNIDAQENGIFFTDNLSVNSTLTFISNIIIDGNNNQFDLDTNAELWIDDNVTVTLQNLILSNLSRNKIVMVGSSSALALDNVTIWLDDDYSFTQGSIYFHNDVIIAGSSHTFVYQSQQPSYLAKQTKLFIDHGLRFSYDTNAKTLLQMVDDTSHIYFDNSTLHANAIGLELSKGTVILDGLVTLSADGQAIGTSIDFGADLTTIITPNTNVQVYGYIDID